MKKVSNIIQFVFVVLFAVCAMGNGLHYSSILFLLAAVLLLPIKFIRATLEKAKLKTWLIIVLAVIIFIVGLLLSPLNEVDSNSDSITETTESINEASNFLSTDNPSTNNPSTDNPSTDNPSTDNPSTDNPSTDNPSTDNPSTDNPSTDNPPTDTPSTDSSTGVGTNPSIPVDPSKISEYSGTPYVVVNNNIPSFSATELTTLAYESYSSLDSLGRCGAAIASCGTEIMPSEDEERGSISSITPSGWIQAQYDCVSGTWLYNRSHLIGWQLSAENANAKNLITGTKYLNVEGMLPFENLVADYIKETGNHVAYRVTPIFEGNNLLCSGVQMEAYSIEDDGEGICFNVYCYNVQPGVTIDYATGASMLENSSSDNNENDDNESSGTTYILNTNSKKFHYPTCSSAEAISEKNRGEYTGDREDLIAQGYSPCGRCDP